MPEIQWNNVGMLNKALRVYVLDEPSAVGASRQYEIGWGDGPDDMCEANPTYIRFHTGIPDEGINGVSMESLLAIVAHRLQGFQSGPFASESNAMALAHIKLAIDELTARTRARADRGVEGIQTP